MSKTIFKIIIVFITLGLLSCVNKHKTKEEQIKQFKKELKSGNKALNTSTGKRTRFRWESNENEYTYYTIYKGKNSDLVTFK